MKGTFKFQTAASPDEIVRYLKTIEEGLLNGSLKITENGQPFTVHPYGLIDLIIKVRRKDGQTRMLLDLAWPEEKPATVTDDSATKSPA